MSDFEFFDINRLKFLIRMNYLSRDFSILPFKRKQIRRYISEIRKIECYSKGLDVLA